MQQKQNKISYAMSLIITLFVWIGLLYVTKNIASLTMVESVMFWIGMVHIYGIIGWKISIHLENFTK